MSKIIDAHTLFGFWPHRRANLTPDLLVKTMQQHSISVSLTLSTTSVFGEFSQGNQQTAEICEKARKMLWPVGTVDPRRYVGSLEEIDQRVKQGFRFWRLFPKLQEWRLDIHPLTEILKRLAERGCTLMVSADDPGDASFWAKRTAPFKLPTILLGPSGRHLGELLSLLGDHPQVMIETRRLADPQVILALAQRFGPQRLIFGTCSPLQYVSSATLPLETANFSDEQRALILGGNIARLAGAGE